MPGAKAIGAFERNLTWWVFGCMAAGIGARRLLPGVAGAIGRMKVAEVNVPVAVLTWLMIVPMLLKIDFSQLVRMRQYATARVLAQQAPRCRALHCRGRRR